ncbi:dynamin family protein [Pseudonocardia asaccharolytica]|uniref:Isoniazid-inducible protein iniA n=1 Tax=Pseudonocardia asaccharolytica DSM 44247 = NBRC 16224 TaxID=1123024 RepID=A0A511CWD8_9PSEU|nr:dynamin family protein [Pseudonocardia asaccharolytica]GEL16787.1 isoniazid-inducible protein iniA [Pseudonocardia asaccharolytica DSM 44247 = NBRC 16224]
MAPTAPVEVVDFALATIARYGRPDLEARLWQARVRLTDDSVRVLVVGEFKQGKSMLVNGLVGAPVCPVADDVATAVPTVVRHAETVTVTVVRVLNPEDDLAEQRTERVEVPVEELADHVGEGGNPGNRKGLACVEVGVPRPILAGGLELVDTPGVGGLSSVHGSATMAALPSADAILLVSDASQEYTAPELTFLRQAVAVCPNVACVLTKNDLYPEWRRVAELDEAHLAAAGVGAQLFPVSSTLRWQAVLDNDSALNEESGYPALVRYLRRRVLGQADRLGRRSTAQDVLAVTGQLAEGLRAEQAAQRDPESVQELVTRLTEAQQRATELRERSARWQQTLGDGVADLNADIDHDLRERMREIARVAEDTLSAGGDPTKTWDEFARWVQQEVAAAASANFVWATQRARWLARRVAEHFSEDSDQLVPTLRAETIVPQRSVQPPTMREVEPWGIGQKALTGLKGSYTGMLMFGMLGTLVGLSSIVNPLSIGAGLVLGGRAIGDERKRLVTRRQNEAKTAVRRHVDDVIFQVGKDSRDRLRAVQRELRDHFTEQADQAKRSLQEAVRAAETSVKTSKAEQERRLREIPTELAKLEEVRRAAKALLQQAPAKPASAKPAPAEGAGTAAPERVQAG